MGRKNKVQSVVPWWLWTIYVLQLALAVWLMIWKSFGVPFSMIPVLSFGVVLNWHRSRCGR